MYVPLGSSDDRWCTSIINFHIIAIVCYHIKFLIDFNLISLIYKHVYDSRGRVLTIA